MREAAGIRPLDNLTAETTPEGILSRPVVTVPIEIYSDERIAEFEQAEAELAVWFQKKSPAREILTNASFSRCHHSFLRRQILGGHPPTDRENSVVRP